MINRSNMLACGRYTLALCIVLAVVFAPLLPVFAQETIQLLQGDIPGVGKTVARGSGGFASYLQSIFKLLISLATILAVLMLIVGGLSYMLTEAVDTKRSAKAIIWGALSGLLLAILAWLILYVINPDLVNFELDIAPVGTTNGGGGDGQGGPNGEPAWPPGGPSQEEDMRNQLKRAGIDIDSSTGQTCTYVGQQGCTSVAGLPVSVPGQLKNLETACKEVQAKCKITITGGTEYWLHDTHGQGEPVVDLRVQPGLNQILTGNTASPPNGTTKSYGGATYSYEDGVKAGTGPHWHVDFDG